MVQVAAKKRKVSKKTRRSWRKHIDIKDVDKFLENERLEERLGTPFSERLDSELFMIDKERSNEPVRTLTTKKERRLALKQKEPRCFAILKPHTAVPDPIAKRNRVKTPEERKNPITRLKEAKRKLNGQLKLKEKIAERNKALAESKRKSRFKRGDFTTDIWEKEPVIQSELNNEWLTSDTIRHTLANTGQKRKRVPKILYKKPSILPAVEAPHPGTSYNPSYDDHQELLVAIAEKEKKLIKEEEHLNRVTTKMFTKVTTEKKTENWINELSEGLPVKSNKKSEDSDLEDTDPVVKSVNPPVKNAKKTLVQRRKQKEQKQLALKQAKEKLEKKKVADVYKLRLLEKQLTSKELKAQELREKRKKLKERKMTEPKTLNKRKFEAPEPDFQMADELAGSLRASAPVGNLLNDRFKSLQQRNILAPSALILKRNKSKVKRFVKPDHKIPVQ